MRSINPLYIAMGLVAIGLLIVLRPGHHDDVSFFGFAENNETKINYNYPVVVDKILVQSGQTVKKGQVLMHISRRKSRDILDDQQFRIAELTAEETAWAQGKRNDLEELELKRDTDLASLNARIQQLEQEIAFKKSLTEGLKSISTSEGAYKPIEDKLKQTQAERANMEEMYKTKVRGLRQEIALGKNPYREQINRLQAEEAFEESQQVLNIEVKAPSDGLIGTISCKEAEHISSYNTLLSFYEPHSGLIKGYVHEDLTLQVQMGDQFEVSSLKDEAIRYKGKVIGLGSRIIEIPTRLRKMPDIKSFGREVLLEIPKENQFLQKEKVGLRRTEDG